jgi:ribosome-binding protein aMBF1 (putative translation factor)
MEEYVDALEDGKIVHVSAGYAKQEGLFVLRKAGDEKVVIPPKINPPAVEIVSRRRSRSPLDLDRYRRPLQKGSVQVELKDNFHWDLVQARKSRNMTRRALADAVGCNEENIKMVENGISSDISLISTLENYFKINLKRVAEVKEAPRKANSTDIELFDDEHDFSTAESSNENNIQK